VDAFCNPTCNTAGGYALRIPQRYSKKSRGMRPCSDYAKSEPDWRVDKRGGTLRHNKNPWITSARFGSNGFRARNFNRKADVHGNFLLRVEGVLLRRAGVLFTTASWPRYKLIASKFENFFLIYRRCLQ
jgi:hypothetical protein